MGNFLLVSYEQDFVTNTNTVFLIFTRLRAKNTKVHEILKKCILNNGQTAYVKVLYSSTFHNIYIETSPNTEVVCFKYCTSTKVGPIKGLTKYSGKSITFPTT